MCKGPGFNSSTIKDRRPFIPKQLCDQRFHRHPLAAVQACSYSPGSTCSCSLTVAGSPASLGLQPHPPPLEPAVQCLPICLPLTYLPPSEDQTDDSNFWIIQDGPQLGTLSKVPLLWEMTHHRSEGADKVGGAAHSSHHTWLPWSLNLRQTFI